MRNLSDEIAIPDGTLFDDFVPPDEAQRQWEQLVVRIVTRHYQAASASQAAPIVVTVNLQTPQQYVVGKDPGKTMQLDQNVLGLFPKRPDNNGNVADDHQSEFRGIAYLSASASALYLGCCRRTLGSWTKNKWLPCCKSGKRFLRYRRTDLDAFMQKHELGAKNAPRVRRRALRKDGWSNAA
jgi:hypothetical protein